MRNDKRNWIHFVEFCLLSSSLVFFVIWQPTGKAIILLTTRRKSTAVLLSPLSLPLPPQVKVIWRKTCYRKFFFSKVKSISFFTTSSACNTITIFSYFGFCVAVVLFLVEQDEWQFRRQTAHCSQSNVYWPWGTSLLLIDSLHPTKMVSYPFPELSSSLPPPMHSLWHLLSLYQSLLPPPVNMLREKMRRE